MELGGKGWGRGKEDVLSGRKRVRWCVHGVLGEDTWRRFGGHVWIRKVRLVA